MRLLQSVLSCLKQTKKPQHKFVTHLLGLMLMLPGHATFRNMSRYSPYHERTFARWYGRNFDWVSLNQAAITEVVPPEHDQVLVLDASFVPKSGQHTYGLDRFWNGSHSRAEKGLELSTLAWLDITENCAYCLRVEQTPPSAATADLEATQMDVSLDQLSRVVKAHDLRFLRYVVTDGAYSKQQFVAGVRPLADNCIELGRGHAKIPRDASQIAAVHIAKLAHFPPMLEPVAEHIDGAFDDRMGFDLGCHGALPCWLNWPSMAIREPYVVAMDQTGWARERSSACG